MGNARTPDEPGEPELVLEQSNGDRVKLVPITRGVEDPPTRKEARRQDRVHRENRAWAAKFRRAMSDLTEPPGSPA